MINHWCASERHVPETLCPSVNYLSKIWDLGPLICFLHVICGSSRDCNMPAYQSLSGISRVEKKNELAWSSRHLSGSSFLRNQGHVSKGALERLSSTINPRVSTGYVFHFRAFIIPFRNVDLPGFPVVFTLDPNKFDKKNQLCLHIGSCCPAFD